MLSFTPRNQDSSPSQIVRASGSGIMQEGVWPIFADALYFMTLLSCHGDEEQPLRLNNAIAVLFLDFESSRIRLGQTRLKNACDALLPAGRAAGRWFSTNVITQAIIPLTGFGGCAFSLTCFQ
jgi:hypothetical protein